jgi:nucleotide-binding universal stress UspA family protein
MPPYKVFVPLDGSRLAEFSLVYLDSLRSLGESRVLLLSVVDEAEDLHSLDPKEYRAREENLLATYLREVSADIENHLGIKVETKVTTGSPASCILAEVGEYSPDLLVISTHGRSGISRWRMGSVADKVIRGAACNTLVVGPKASERSTWMEARLMEAFKSLLVPLDGSALAETALPVATMLADSYGSAIHLVQVVGIPTAAAGGLGEVAYMPDLLDTLKEAAKAYLKNTVAKLNRDDVEAKVLVGGAAWQLEDYIEANAIDLVVMTSHGRGGFIRTALGSVTDRLLGGAAPVLVVRPQE